MLESGSEVSFEVRVSVALNWMSLQVSDEEKVPALLFASMLYYVDVRYTRVSSRGAEESALG